MATQRTCCMRGKQLAKLHCAGVEYACVELLPSTSLLQPILKAQSSRAHSALPHYIQASKKWPWRGWIV